MQHTPQVPRIICLGFGLSGVAAYVVMALIDIHYGEATALTQAGKTFQPVTMAIVSAIGFLLVCGSGALYRARRYTMAAILFAATGAYMGYSALNGVGFFAGETIGKVRQVEAKNKSLKEATDRANDEAKEMRTRTLSWLTGTQIRTAKERERVEDKVIELVTKPVEVKAAPVDAVVGDMRSEVMKKLLGVEIENAQIANSVWVVGLLVLGKLLGPSLMFALWPIKSPPKANSIDRPPDGDGETFTNNLKNPANMQVLSGGKVSQQRRYEPAEARKDLVRMLGEAPTIDKASRLVDRWNWSLPSVLRYLDRWEAEGICRTRKDGRDRVILRPGPKAVSA